MIAWLQLMITCLLFLIKNSLDEFVFSNSLEMRGNDDLIFFSPIASFSNILS